jgi:hypothetical protein
MPEGAYPPKSQAALPGRRREEANLDLFIGFLFAKASAANRRPHLQRDDAGPRCASPACHPGDDPAQSVCSQSI